MYGNDALLTECLTTSRTDRHVKVELHITGLRRSGDPSTKGGEA